jgi:Ca-activated chloride channel family protein
VKFGISLAACLLLFAGPARAEGFWPKLWFTPDQRGELLLRQGDAAAAAKTYADPRRRAYAELQAGDYPAAARDLAGFDDAEADYNRGNALAHAGDLKEALKAYDRALAHDPKNQDARHNRELVAKALQQQPPQKQQDSSGKGQGKSGKNQSGQNQSGKQNGDQGKSSEKGDKDGNDKGDHGKQPAANQNPPSGATQNGKPGQDQAGQQGKDQGKSQASGAKQNQAPGAEQARRDAEASVGDQPNKQQPDGREANAAAAGQDTAGKPHAGATDLPTSEQQLAEEQWLRQIPDDPGGLLRRKFMIEHLMRRNQR